MILAKSTHSKCENQERSVTIKLSTQYPVWFIILYACTVDLPIHDLVGNKILHYVVFLAIFSCGHYAADFLFTCSVTTLLKAKLTNQRLTSFVSRKSRDEGGNKLRFLRDTPFWIVSLQQWLNEAVFLPGFVRRILPISTPLTTKMSLCRQNYHEECEAGINKQINLELYASYVYMSMVGFQIAFEQNTLFLGELKLNVFYSYLKGLSLRSWWCGSARIPQVHAETVGRRTRTRSKGI